MPSLRTSVAKLVRVSSQLTPETVSQALQESLAELAGVEAAPELRALKGKLIGESSPISRLNALIKDLPNDQKAEAGKLVGAARAELNAAFEAKESELEALERAELLKLETVDITAAPQVLRRGARHPLSATDGSDFRGIRRHGLGNCRWPRAGERVVQL